jgi:hypothetical protein
MLVMRKRYNLGFWDIGFIEIADILIAFWIVGLFLVYSEAGTVAFLIEWKWAFFAVAVIVGIKPFWKMGFGPHSDEAKPSRRVVRRKVQKAVKKKKKVKKR